VNQKPIATQSNILLDFEHMDVTVNEKEAVI